MKYSPPKLADLKLFQLRELIEAAQKELGALCRGKRFDMTIPVQADDSDVVIGDGLRAGIEALIRCHAYFPREDEYEAGGG